MEEKARRIRKLEKKIARLEAKIEVLEGAVEVHIATIMNLAQQLRERDETP